MSSSDPSPPFVHLPSLPNVTDSMVLWPQFPIDNESNFHIDYPPPFKRPKILDENYLPSTPFPPTSSRITRTNPVVNQPTGRIFFKTRPCTKFRMGQCRNGENCNFAHGEEDLRKPPPNWQELVPGRADGRGVGNGGNWEDDDKIIHRMKICKKFYSGEECPYGDKCNFLHKEPARFRDPLPVRNRDNAIRESSAISIGTLGPPLAQQPICGIDQYTARKVGEAGYDASRENLRSTYFKTKFCAKWETTGHCPFGEKCHFAHGHGELQLGGHPGEELAVSVSGVPKPIVPAPVTEPVGTANKADATWPAQNQEGRRKNNCLLKWKETKKINRIYGDWIDDLPLNLPNEVEN